MPAEFEVERKTTQSFGSRDDVQSRLRRDGRSSDSLPLGTLHDVRIYVLDMAFRGIDGCF